MGRKAISNREEQRDNQIAIPLSACAKNRIKEATKKRDRSMASFVRIVLNEYFEREAK